MAKVAGVSKMFQVLCNLNIPILLLYLEAKVISLLPPITGLHLFYMLIYMCMGGLVIEL